MDAVELPGALAAAAELAEVVEVLVQDHHAVIVEPVRDEHPPVRQERDILWLGEVGAVASGMFFSPSVFSSCLPSFEKT